jgi:DNA (cytosine-5)-methyltransferase 1
MMQVDTFFSGIGGFDLGFERAGFTINSVCEIDKPAQGILARHFPNVKIYDDIRKVGFETHGKTSGIVCGGFPCQDLSIAGKRAGLAGERSGLWYEFARVIDELEPRWVIIENVPGLLSSNKGMDFTVIIQWLVKRGYGVSWRVLDAQYFGVAQRRRRVFIVASFGNGRCAEVLFEREGVSRDTKTRGETREGTAGTFTIRSGKDGGGKGYLGAEDKAMTLGGQEQYLELFDRQRSDEYGESDTVSTISRRDYKSASDLIAYNIQHNDGGEHKRKDRPNGGLYVNETKTALTVGTTDLTAITHNVGVRRLTPTECERLQGFPDGWTDGQSDTQRYKQLGNAVAVPVIEWLANRIWEAGV